VTPRRADLARVVRAAVEAQRAGAAEKEVVLEAEVADVGEVVVDPERMEQVVSNLLLNAVKFTPPKGRVRLTMARVKGLKGAKMAGVEIRVEDTGRGMSAEFLPRLFERFSQEDGGPAKGKGGLGLGLAIARQIVELHGGTIEGTSAGVGKGSVFVVRLPAGK
jgi:signal transduction histidine kinase